MNIGLVDQDQNFIEQFKKEYFEIIIKKHDAEPNKLYVSNNIFNDEMLEKLDILFINVDKNILELRHKISKIKCVICILNTEYIRFDLLSLNPKGFIRKTNFKNDYSLLHMNDNKYLKVYDYYGRKHFINISEIKYFVACGHEITVVASLEYRITSSLKKIMNELHDSNFIQIEKSICININQIKEMVDNCIVMNDGKSFLLSNYFKKAFINRVNYVDYN